jgi:Tfp pilus assembly protein PilF
MDSGDYIKAGLEFRNALKFNDKLPDAWFGLATVEEQKQNWPVVLDSLQRTAELDPKNSEARIKLAKLHLAANKLEVGLARPDSSRGGRCEVVPDW